jgi:hypothetical protein
MWAYTIDAKLMADDVGRAYRQRGFATKSFQHTFSFPRLSPATLNTRATSTITLDSDALFVCVGLVASKRQGGFHTAVAGLGLKLVDLAGNYSFAGAEPLPSEAFTGSAESPYIFGFPYVFAPNARVKADVIHLSGSGLSAAPTTTAVLFDLALIGVKLYTTPYTRDVFQPEH